MEKRHQRIKETKTKTKEEVTTELIGSLQEIDAHANEKLNESVQDYKKIVKSKKKGSLNVAFRPGKIFKIFKDSARFGDMLKQLGVSYSTVYFKSNMLKLLEKYPAEKIILNIDLF